ncbi:hypothetical protein L1887_42857 [Cichorium endivia]|nr:hypothetical protein L1887_42857 [Cichorium endivia]
MRLSGVDIDGNFMPFDMQPSQIAMNFNGMSSTLSGSVLTQQGQINLSGDADWSQLDNWRARIAREGQVRCASPYRRWCAWTFRLMWSLKPRQASSRLTDVSTCRGRASWFTTMPESAVGVSSDEVMLNENLKPVEQKSAGIPINSNLIVHVGNNVRFECVWAEGEAHGRSESGAG